MRTLNRPMFNMGGPIKEGVMHGIREPYRSGTRVGFANGTPPINQSQLIQQIKNFLSKTAGTGGTTGTTGTIGQTGSKAANLLSKAKAWKIPTDVQLGRGIWGGLKKAYSMAPKQGFLFRNPLSVLAAGAYFGGAPTPVDKKYGITSRWENIAPMFGDTTGIMEKKFKRNLAEEANPNNPYRYNKYKHGPRKEHPDYDPEKSSYWPWAKGAAETAPLKTLDENLEMPPRDTGSDYGQFDRAQKRIAEGKATELAKQQKDDRVNKLLEMMGHKQSKKDAVYDALIDASQIVTQAPGGKTLDITKDIISPAIAATSKRFDKPKEIEEAVRLMMVKGEIEKDIASGKGGPLKQNAKDLVAAGVFKNETEAMKHLASKKTMGNVVAEVSKQFGISGANADVLDTSLRIKEDVIPQGKWKGDNKVYKEFKNNNKDKADIELEFVKDIDDRKAGDYYIVDKRIVLVDENLNPDYYY